MASKSLGLSAKDELALMTRLWSTEIKDNPYNFVMWAFPWGQKGTPLEHQKGPRAWQKKILLEIADHIKENKERVLRGEAPLVYQLSVASGRGIGKSALLSMVTLWMMSCIQGSSTIVTANTEEQLKSKTWAELGKWHTLLMNAHWFEKTTMSLTLQPWLQKLMEEQLKLDCTYYYGKALLWSEEKPDSFAGAHNYNGVLLIFDEASGIPQPIWSVSEGFFTEPTVYRFWLTFSNPRRNTGAFFECFHKMRNFWSRMNIDSRTVEGTDKRVYDQIINKYGEDSDEVRVEVKGQFPRQGDKQFISREQVENATVRELFADNHAGLIMGVDVARHGDDSTVIFFRQGRNARLFAPQEFRKVDNVFVADKCAELIDKYKPDAVCIDSGAGAGVIDILRSNGYRIHEVVNGSSSSKEQFANKRTELWDSMREWLIGGCIPQHQTLQDDLTGPEYRFHKKTEQILLEPKEEMKARGVASPNFADALSFTFAVRVARKDQPTSKKANRSRVAKDIDFNPFSS